MVWRKLIRIGLRIYRHIPIGGAARRKLRALLMASFVRSKRVFIMDWHEFRLEIDPAQSIDMRLYMTGEYEPETQAVISQLAPLGATVIDIGANIGLLSLWAAKCVGPAGRVISVEPSQWACARIRRNAELSGIENMEVITAAASDRSCEADLDVINGYRIDDIDTRKVERVRHVTVDEIVAERNITDIALMKVDTDGFKIVVLRGAEKTLATMRPAIVFEYGPDHLRRHSGAEPSELISLLRRHGYEIFDECLQPVDPSALRLAHNETLNLVARHPDRPTSHDHCTNLH